MEHTETKIKQIHLHFNYINVNPYYLPFFLIGFYLDKKYYQIV